MVAPVPIVIADKPPSLLALLGLFLVHTFAVYVCALFFSPRLVATWFNVIAPFFHVEASTWSADWYLHHLVVVSAVPAMIVGYINVRHPESLAPWVWVVPSLLLGYKLLTYHASGSALNESSLSGLAYLFDTQLAMPTFRNPFAGDPARVLAQMNITAPFCAAVSYSLGAAASKRHLIRAVFSFRRAPETE